MQKQGEYHSNSRIGVEEEMKLQAEPGQGPLREGVERVTNWNTVAVPNRQWLVDGWLPAGRIGMFSGPDGGGKSIMVMALAAAMASGGGLWLGRGGVADSRMPEAKAGAVVYASWEDEIGQARLWLEWLATERRRLRDDDLIAAVGERLHFLDLSRRGPVWGAQPGKVSGLLEAGRIARTEVEACDADLLVLDSLGYAYGDNGDENAGVATFMADMDGWGRDVGCAVMLVHHPGKDPESSYRGASSWQAHARWRWQLYPADKKEGKPPRLACEKASYAMRPDPVWLQPRNRGNLTWRESGDQAKGEDIDTAEIRV